MYKQITVTLFIIVKNVKKVRKYMLHTVEFIMYYKLLGFHKIKYIYIYNKTIKMYLPNYERISVAY